MLTEKKENTYTNLINCLIALIPLSLIIGNLATNINITLICLVGLATYKFQTFTISQKKYQLLIYAFFLYLILITLFVNLPKLDDNLLYKEHIIKSLSFLRFLLLFLIVNKLFEKNHFNINLFFISCAFFSFIVAIDILIQVKFGQNLLGFYITANRPSSFFGSEHIAGGFMQKYSLFFVFFLLFYLKRGKVGIYILLLFFFFFVSILLTSNKMPTVLYLFGVLIFFILEKKFKEIFFFLILVSIIIFSILKYPPYPRANVAITLFYTSVIENATKLPKLFYTDSYSEEQKSWEEIYKMKQPNYISKYTLIFNSALQVWKRNKFFGSGLKSFKLNCRYAKHQSCSTHPHNYIIEILIDTGIVGFTLIYSIFILSILNFFNFYFYNSNSNSRFLSLPFFLIIFLELFPIRSSGSFFTTNNSTVIFLMLAVLINVQCLKFYEKKLQ
jgi:O-antigen ligase